MGLEKFQGKATSSSELEVMPFLEHLAELRDRLIRVSLAVVVGAVVCFMFASELFEFLRLPLSGWKTDMQLIGTGPAEAFVVKLKVSLLCGFILSAPYLLFQIWGFVAPGLYQSEKRLVIPFVAISTLFFFVGVVFCYYVVLPFAFGFFAEEFSSLSVSPQIKIGEYLSFVAKLILVFGLVFELPIASYFLTRAGVIDEKWLKENASYALVVIVIVAALLTPPDVATQLFLAVPLLILYGLCILVARFASSR